MPSPAGRSGRVVAVLLNERPAAQDVLTLLQS
jgi:hypothetical protein